VTLRIPDFSRLDILVAGDAMLDEYWFGDTARISPEAPVPVVQTVAREQRPGGAANVALNVAALGAMSSLAAIVGQDAMGAQLERILGDHGVGCRLLRVESVPTIHKLRVLSRSQQLIRLDSEQTLRAHGREFAEFFGSWVPAADIVILSDYAKGTLSEAAALIDACRKHGKRVLVDPKGTDFARYRGAHVLTPNQQEFEAVVGGWDSETAFIAKGQALRRELGIDFLLVTRGEKGMTLFTGVEAVSLAAEAREVFDVTGAGDTVIALMAAGLGAGLSAADAAALANLGAGLVVGKIGVASVSPVELATALHRGGRGGRGIVATADIEMLVRDARARGERIVMTNGCFDILHAGHVAYLEEAKSLGDRLVVAVNDDASVGRLKGSGRPITALADRMLVLAGLAAVDWVVSFAEDTPTALIERLLPDVLVKGGDYRPEGIAGAEAVRRAGGEIRVLSFRQGLSTSALIAAIRGDRTD
jgi:D-beta-D-heptose 7-phosphate kinase/D-beta-D-heptose 1-phosphate adenosyltransferase